MFEYHKYDNCYYVHSITEDWSEASDTFDSLDKAVEFAKDWALQGAGNYEITHVLIRPVKRINVTIEVEDL